MNNFLEFIEKRKNMHINENFDEKNIENALELVNKVLSKHINGLLPLMVTQPIGMAIAS